MGLFETLEAESVSAQDCVNIRYITNTICKRSAHLLSAAIATLINKMSVTPSTVGIDGGFYRNHSKYPEMIKDKIKCMINPNIQVIIFQLLLSLFRIMKFKMMIFFCFQFDLVLSEDGSGRGAALAVACRKD